MSDRTFQGLAIGTRDGQTSPINKPVINVLVRQAGALTKETFKSQLKLKFCILVMLMNTPLIDLLSVYVGVCSENFQNALWRHRVTWFPWNILIIQFDQFEWIKSMLNYLKNAVMAPRRCHVGALNGPIWTKRQRLSRGVGRNFHE